MIFREGNNRAGNPDFKRNGNKCWLIGNYKEGQARRDYIDVEVYAPNPFPKGLLNKYIVESDYEWNQITDILLSNDAFSEFFEKTQGYVKAVYVKSAEHIPKTKKKYNVEKEKLKDTTHVSINYKYIETNVDMSFNTLKEAIENKDYIKDECWLNSIYDFYKDILLKDKKK